jgi:hypothetical protein
VGEGGVCSVQLVTEGRGVHLHFGVQSNQDVQLEVCCSRTRRRLQDRVTGEGVEGSVEAACLASMSASSLPGMAVYPGI